MRNQGLACRFPFLFLLYFPRFQNDNRDSPADVHAPASPPGSPNWPKARAAPGPERAGEKPVVHPEGQTSGLSFLIGRALLTIYRCSPRGPDLSFYADNPTHQHVLVLVDDVAVRSSHSIFFRTLQARGFNLDFKLADNPKLSPQRYGQYLYDGLILFSPSIQSFGGSLDQKAVLDFVDAGHDLILAADSSASDLIRGIAT